MVYGNDVNTKYPADVPGNIYTDLMAAEVIQDPFKGTNETDVEWVARENWTYESDTFSVSPELLNKSHVVMRFEGLDTYCNVWLNGEHILSANNYFIPWEVDVKGKLKKSGNQLTVKFRSATVTGEIMAGRTPYDLPGAEVRAVTRKPQFHYGWDWGPTLPGCGIHDKVFIEGYNTGRISSFEVECLSIHEDHALARYTFDIEMMEDVAIQLHVSDGFRRISEEAVLDEGSHQLTYQHEIPLSALWWPAGHGKQVRWPIQIRLQKAENIVDVVEDHYAIRKAGLITEEDEYGESFYFQINEQPIFAKGANYIPMDIFQNRVSKSDYDALFDAVLAANMNMIRIWGGGIYETDYFYDQCDSLGIMIWQDFMYACAMYPGDEFFLENAAQEAESQVNRLKKHPSIVLWCGNNENAEGWARWGWQDSLKRSHRKKISKSYKKLFCKLLPEIVEENVALNYWESSPRLGRGDPNHRFEGDAHYWGIWHDAQPFDTLNYVVPRFMSEFGFQSFPNYPVVQLYAGNNPQRDDPAVISHEKHPRGFKLIDDYMIQDFGRIPEEFEDYIWLSQIQQARGIKIGLEAHRRNAPYCMGTLYWQLNDCWPVASWSSLDYLGNWKPLHFAAQKAFEPNQLMLYVTETGVETHFIGEDMKHLTNKTARCELIWYSMDGTEVGKSIGSFNIQDSPSQKLLVENFPDSTVRWKSSHFVQAKLQIGEISFDCHSALDKPKNTSLKIPNILFDVRRETRMEYAIKVQSNTFTQGVWLETNSPGEFSDNYFDLLPGKIKHLRFKAETQENPEIVIRTLNELMAKYR